MKKFGVAITLILILLTSFCLSSCGLDDTTSGNNNSNSTVGGVSNVIDTVTEIVKQVKTTDKKRIADCSVDCNYVSAYITPSGFDYDELEDVGYSYMKITVSYQVSYTRTLNGWDFLYAGSPKYDVIIYNEDYLGVQNIGLTTGAQTISRSISYTSELVNLRNNRIKLVMGSTNIQNRVIFTDIVVTYKCYK